VTTPPAGDERLFDRQRVRRIRTDGFVEPCIPSRAPKPPSGPDWVHEVKHGLPAGRGRAPVTRRGYAGLIAIPPLLRAAAKLKAKSFTLDDGLL
jgi:bifunctional non-homologous end joining protein LigD